MATSTGQDSSIWNFSQGSGKTCAFLIASFQLLEWWNFGLSFNLLWLLCGCFCWWPLWYFMLCCRPPLSPSLWPCSSLNCVGSFWWKIWGSCTTATRRPFFRSEVYGKQDNNNTVKVIVMATDSSVIYITVMVTVWWPQKGSTPNSGHAGMGGSVQRGFLFHAGSI